MAALRRSDSRVSAADSPQDREVIIGHALRKFQHDKDTREPVRGTSGGPGSGLTPLSYGYGDVLTSPIVVPVFWGFKAVGETPLASLDPDNAVPNVINFMNGLSTSPWLATLHQYYELVIVPKVPSFSLQQVPVVPRSLQVTTPIFDDDTSPGTSYTNNDLANEAQRIAARIGYNFQEIIVVFTPHGSINATLIAESACGQHFGNQTINAAGLTAANNYTYVTVPYLPDPAYDGCRGSFVNSPLDGMTIVLGHEIAETITDPYAFTGWNSAQGEIGDLCAWQGLMDQPFSGQLYATQPLWSNQATNCIQMTVAMKTWSGNYVTAANGGGLGGANTALQTNRTVASTRETFTLNWLAPWADQFDLKTLSGNFVTAVNGGGIGGPNSGLAPIHTDASSIGFDEEFELEETACVNGTFTVAPNTCITLQTYNGDFVTAVNGGGFGGPNNVPIHTDATQVGSWELFTFVTP